MREGGAAVKTLEIRETTASMASEMGNAYISFRDMTTSVVSIVTDQVRDGRPVLGYGFNSNGRYAVGGLLRERFIPRLRRAAPREAGTNLDPERAWRIMMTDEKPGGHGERAVAVGTLDMALWDIVAKLAGQPLYRVLADRYNGGVADTRVAAYAAGGYYQPGKDERALQDELRGYLDLAARFRPDDRAPHDGHRAARHWLQRWARACRARGGDGGRWRTVPGAHARRTARTIPYCRYSPCTWPPPCPRATIIRNGMLIRTPCGRDSTSRACA